MTTVPPSPAFLRRHARVWLDAACVETLPADTDETVIRHVQRGLPFVMRLVLDGDPPDGVPLDGEIELPDGRAVSWKELAGDTRYVLVKSAHGVALAERDAIWHSQHWN